MRGGAEQHAAGQARHERRKHPRKRAFLPATLEVEGERVECRVLDLSPGGAKVELERALGERQMVSLILPPFGTFRGLVAWRGEGAVGLQFTDKSAAAGAGARNVTQAQMMHALHRIAGPESAKEEMPEPVKVPAKAPADDTPVTVTKRAAPRQHGPRDVLRLLRGEENVFTLKAGQVLFREGDPSGRMYIVRTGRLSIESGDGAVEEVESGGILGEMGLVEQHLPRSATATAITDCELVEIDGRRFSALIEEAPGFAVMVMQVLSRRLRHMDGAIEAERQSARPPTPLP